MYSCLWDEFTRGDKNVFLLELDPKFVYSYQCFYEREFFLVYEEISLSKMLNQHINIQGVTLQRTKFFTFDSQIFKTKYVLRLWEVF
jgi:hypothetical protein